MKTNSRSFRAGAAFTLVEILIAIGILGLVLTAIYSSWTAILRASKVGLDAAASVQRSRIAMRTLEDALTCAQAFEANRELYEFIAENGNEATLSFVARLPGSFPRNSKFRDFPLRRVSFALDSGNQFVLQQSPLLTELDEDEANYPLVLAKHVQAFEMEFWDGRLRDWTDEWRETNQVPSVIRVTLKIADSANAPRNAVQEISRIVSIPSRGVGRMWQSVPAMPGQQLPGGVPGPGGIPGAGGPLPGQVPNPGVNQPRTR
jgi:type II secretion system protein J